MVPACSSFSITPVVMCLAALSAPLLLAWRRSRRPVVTVTMSIGPVVATATAYTVAIVSTAAASAADAAVVFDVPAAALPTPPCCPCVCVLGVEVTWPGVR